MRTLVMSAAFLLAALVVAPNSASAQDAPAKEEKKATDKTPEKATDKAPEKATDKAGDAAEAVVYELTVDGLH